MTSATQHKAHLRAYFDGVGFERWSAIYGEAKLSLVRRSIRNGHTAMLNLVGKWLDEHYPQVHADLQALDAGCGPGLLTMELAQRDFSVTAVDIAEQMVTATRQKLQSVGLDHRIRTVVSDLEHVSGSYDVVCCLDVLIHYGQPGFSSLCKHLAQLCKGVLIITYAPYSPALALLHRLALLFPRSQRRTDIQMIPDHVVRQTLAAAGMQIGRSTQVSNGFYHVTLLEAFRTG